VTDPTEGPASGSPSRSEGDASLLVVDDEPGFLTVLERALSSRGYHVRTAATGTRALDLAAVQEPDVTILDLGLPDLDGVEVCRQLRRWVRNPIVVLTADGAEDRKVAALDQGADDYVTKPFSMPELLARVRVALRHRWVLAGVVGDGVLTVGTLRLDPGGHEATLDGRPLVLTRKEFALLELLVRNLGRVLTHKTLLAQIWGDGEHDVATLRTHVNQLRRKLADGRGAPQLVTDPGIGYRLVDAAG
jgi:two-component system KDP operon response regulator KdpE